MKSLSYIYRKKILIIMITLVVVPLIIIFCMSFISRYNEDVNKTVSTANILLNNEAKYIEKLFYLSFTSFDDIGKDAQIYDYIKRDSPVSNLESVEFYNSFRRIYLTKSENTTTSKISKFVDRKMINNLVYLDVYSDNPNLQYADFLHMTSELDNNILNNLNENNSYYYWYLNNQISIYKKIYLLEDDTFIIAKITFEPEVFKREYNDTLIESSFLSLKIINSKYNLQKSKFVLHKDNLEIERKLDSTDTKRDDLYLEMVIPNSYIFNQIKNNIIFFIISFMFIVLALFLILKYASRYLTNRLYMLIEKIDMDIDKITATKLDLYDKKNDEFALITRKVYELIIKIDEDNKRITESEIQKKHLEIRVLQELFNPHFLYNTLACIKYVYEENNTLSTIIDDMVNYYRIALNQGENEISIKKELSQIESYIRIQRFAYNKEIILECNVNNDVLDFKIIKLLIQPFVENSVIHGISGMKTGGKIEINIRKNENIIIEIIDNGRGIKKEKLESIFTTTVSDEKRNYGIYNILEKIKLFYDDNNLYGVNIESKENVGTTVTITVPLIE